MVRQCTTGLVALKACRAASSPQPPDLTTRPQPPPQAWCCPLPAAGRGDAVDSMWGPQRSFCNCGVGDGKPILWGSGSALLPGPPWAPVSPSLGRASAFLWLGRARCAGALRTTLNAAGLAPGTPGQASTYFASWGGWRPGRAVVSPCSFLLCPLAAARAAWPPAVAGRGPLGCRVSQSISRWGLCRLPEIPGAGRCADLASGALPGKWGVDHTWLISAAPQSWLWLSVLLRLSFQATRKHPVGHWGLTLG